MAECTVIAYIDTVWGYKKGTREKISYKSCNHIDAFPVVIKGDYGGALGRVKSRIDDYLSDIFFKGNLKFEADK